MRQKVMTENYCSKSTEPGKTEDEQKWDRQEGEFCFKCESLAGNPEDDEQKSKANSKSCQSRPEI